MKISGNDRREYIQRHGHVGAQKEEGSCLSGQGSFHPVRRLLCALLVALLLCCSLLCSCGRQGERGQGPGAVRIGSLKGPTSLGILFLMEEAKENPADYPYEFRMATGADELLPLLVKGELDIALVPANVAAALYQKTEGGVTVIDINTLGVLYLVAGSLEIEKVSDLEGRTIYLTGKGATPEASLKYILEQNGLKPGDYTLEYKSEAAEVAAVLAQDPAAIGLLPQPFATAALMQNENLRIALDMNEEWEAAREREGSQKREDVQKREAARKKEASPDNSQEEEAGGMVTGVTIVRNDFLRENREAVEDFLKHHKDSVSAVNDDPDKGAVLAVEAGIVAKEAIAREAIPRCNLVCVTGEEMKGALSAYLEVLVGFNAELVGGKLPEEDFYYLY